MLHSSDYGYIPVPVEPEPIWNQEIGRLPARFSPRPDRLRGTSPPMHVRGTSARDFNEEIVRNDPERLQEEIDKMHQQEEDRRKRLHELSAIWEKRRTEIEEEIAQLHKNREDCMQEKLLLLEPPDPPPEFAGPDILRCVESDAFHFLATLVILANLIIMVLEMVDHKYEDRWWYLDHLFMSFYLMELTLKAILMQGKLLCGKVEVVWWNYLDIIIVVSGVVDMWVRPLFVTMHIMPEQRKGPSILSFLRMLRLSRVLKIIGVFLHADLSWAEGPTFQLFIMGVIGFNSILMGLEADIPDFFLWYYVEQLLLVIFSFELLVRIRHSGCEFFFSNTNDLIWNWLDFIIVFGGIVDQWLMPIISLVDNLIGEEGMGESDSMGQFMTILRMARLLRILRLVRLVKSIPPLYTLIVGIVQAMQGMGWVLVLTTVLLYAFALLGVKLVGHGLLFGGNPVDAEVTNIFPTVFESMFVLFRSMNGDWEALEPLFIRLPFTKVVFIMFTVISTWAILSILTAVVSDNMINATNMHRDEELQEEHEEKAAATNKMLEDIFNNIGRSSRDHISKSEFDQLLHGSDDPTDADALKKATNLSERDLEEIFDILSRVPSTGGDPVVAREAFSETLQIESAPVSMRAMMKLEKRICDIEHLLQSIASEFKTACQDYGKCDSCGVRVQ